MDVRPLGFEWRPRSRVARVVSRGVGAFVGVCLAGALALLAGSVVSRCLPVVWNWWWRVG
jgi:hypothetical protein